MYTTRDLELLLLKNEKPIMKSIFKILLLIVLPFIAYSADIPVKHNIIFIFVDDQGYYDLGCYGATEVKTPRIDALSEKGIRFTDYYAAAPICSPSRAGLLTGCYPIRTGNHIWVHRPDSETGIPPSVLTMPELFQNKGYATACIGKWHIGFKEPYLPGNQGFDFYFGLMHNQDKWEVVHYEKEGGLPLWRNGDVVQRDPDPGSLTKMYTDEAISWIKQQTSGKKQKPFFLYLPHTMLHHPLGVSKEFEGSSNWGLYGDAIQEMDYNVGRLVDALDEMEIAGETIILYVSDNGRQGGRNKNQPLQGKKLTTYECGLRVPCIAYCPGIIAEGKTSNVVAHAMDWYPTLASLSGFSVPEDVVLDGRDLSALLSGKTEEIPAFEKNVSLNAEIPLRRKFHPYEEWEESFTREEYINAFFYHGSHGALAAVRSGKWKLSLNPELKLYNLEKDPGERIPVNDSKIKRKLRGMAILFQLEMQDLTISKKNIRK